MLYATDEKDADKSQHTEGLNCKSADGTAAESDLDRLTDG